MATFYTGVDQERYDAGNKYLPQDRFLLNYQAPTTNVEEEKVTTSYGIPNTNAFINSGGGGGGGNYTTGYRPNYEYRKSLDYNPELSDLQNQKIMQNMENYKGYDYYNEPEPTGLAKGIDTALNYVPFIGPMKRGIEFLGDTFGKYMPVNQRAIMENELRGAGVFTDNLGRIVATPGQYNTPEGIMAGYNANQMTDKTFDKRTGNITEALAKKAKGLGLDISQEQLAAIAKDIEETGTYTGEYTDETFGAKNLFSNLVNVNKAKFNFQKTKQEADNIYEWEKKQKENQPGDGKTYVPPNWGDSDTGGKGEFEGWDSGGFDPGHGYVDQGGQGEFGGGWSQPEKQGTTPGAGLHADYNQGGRVGLRYGGLLSIL